MANNKKAVLFTIDEEVYHQLRYKKRNMSAHVNSLIRQSVFSDENDRRGQTLRDASFRDLVAEAWFKAEPQSFESKLLLKMKESLDGRPMFTSSSPDEDLSTP